MPISALTRPQLDLLIDPGFQVVVAKESKDLAARLALLVGEASSSSLAPNTLGEANRGLIAALETFAGDPDADPELVTVAQTLGSNLRSQMP